MSRKSWLMGLKEGDVVANKKFNAIDKEFYYSFHKIKNINQKGYIRLDNDILLNENGQCYKYSGTIDYFIQPVTKDIAIHEAKRKKRKMLYLEISDLLEKKLIDCKTWDVDKLEKVKQMIKLIENDSPSLKNMA